MPIVPGEKKIQVAVLLSQGLAADWDSMEKLTQRKVEGAEAPRPSHKERLLCRSSSQVHPKP